MKEKLNALVHLLSALYSGMVTLLAWFLAPPLYFSRSQLAALLTIGSGAVALPPPWDTPTQYQKTRYIEYTDATFMTRKGQPEWLGILGPVIRAEVGDTIVVDFLNRSRGPHSIHPHGLRYDKQNEGASYLGGGGPIVYTGMRATYRWEATERSGPGPNNASSIVWWYHPHSDESFETNAGLLGPIIITARAKAKPDGSPIDVDEEFVAVFMIFDELRAEFGTGRPDRKRFQREPNNENELYHAINGYVFGNLPGYIAEKGSRVRWHLMGMGSERDIHTPHWHGQTVTLRGIHTDVIELLPASMVTADMIADNPGTWLFHCQVTDHMEAGMMATYTVYEPAGRCPVKFVSANLWNNPDQFSLSVENTSQQTIQKMILGSATFDPPLDLRPSLTNWAPGKALASGAQQTLTAKNFSHRTESIPGWAFYPIQVEFADGTKWLPKQRGECFTTYWRDKQHPEIRVLPPLQVEMSED